MPRVVITILLFLCSNLVTAQVSKWVDQEGNVHYGTKAPTSMQSLEMDSRISVVEAVRRNTLQLYTTTRCGYCKSARAYLNKRGIAFEEQNTDLSAIAKAQFARFGRGGVPLLVDNDRVLRGFNKGSYDAFFDSSGR